jgi:hypothetical protein
MAEAPLPAYPCCMRHNKGFHDQYQPPDGDDEGLDRIHARFDRLALRVKDASGTGRTKFIRPANLPETPVFAPPEQELFPMMTAWPVGR